MVDRRVCFQLPIRPREDYSRGTERALERETNAEVARRCCMCENMLGVAIGKRQRRQDEEHPLQQKRIKDAMQRRGHVLRSKLFH